MKILTDLAKMGTRRRPVVLAAGFFDGVHRGHCKVIRRTIVRARQASGQAWILTFDQHPLRVLNPEAVPLLLTANRHKLALLARTGIDGCLLLPFTHKQATVEPMDFINTLREQVPTLTHIVVGQNWRFGKGGRGTPGLVSREGSAVGLGVTTVAPVIYRGETISSTRIRAAVLHGNLAEASAMLGRTFGILGTVRRGRSIGRKIGFPTANLDPHNEVLPPHGVYAVYAGLDGRVLSGVLNFGLRPTISDGSTIPTLELHLFDYSGDLYGHDIEVFFVEFLREELKFDGIETMRAAIAEDIRHATSVLRGKKLKESLYTCC